MSNNWLRPRRLVDSYVSYLLGVQPLIEAAVVVSPPTNDDNDEAAEGGDDEDGKAAALRNVMEEIKFQTASAATDKRTSALLELLVQAAGPKAAVVALARCAPYAAFIAHNRHGSHVLQTLLSMVGEQIREKQKQTADDGSGGWVMDRSATSKSGGNDDNADEEEDDAEWGQEPEAVVVMLWDHLIGLTSTSAESLEEGAGADDATNRKAATTTEASPREVVQSLVALSCDVCAAHVLRALLCVLSGAPVVQERRGKNARHGQEAGATLAEPSALRTEPRVPPPPVLRNLWERTVALLAGSNGTDSTSAADSHMTTCATAVELQHMSCDPSGAATLGLLLQLEATGNITQRGSSSHQNSRHNSSGSSAAGGDAEDGPLADWSNQASFGVLGELRAGSSAASGKVVSSNEPLSPGLRLLLRLLEFDDFSAIVERGSGKSSAAVASGEASGESGSSAEGASSSSSSSSRAADVVYGLAGEAAASHLLETALRVLPNDYLEALVRQCLAGSLHEYVLVLGNAPTFFFFLNRAPFFQTKLF